jgi:5-methylthioadenosine/S-adenosylhomocysteine deaminase
VQVAKKKGAPPGELLPKNLIVRGHLVTMDERKAEIPDGVMYVDRDGIIHAVRTSRQRAPAGWSDANVIETDGLVFPGLIDLHNHIAYNCLPLWSSVKQREPWRHREQWPGDMHYKERISLPTNALCHADGKAVLKYVETKAVVGGVTAIQGSAKTKGATFEGWMVRNIEHDTFRTGQKTVNQSVRPISSEAGYREIAKKVNAPGFSPAKKRDDVGNAYLYHLCEGVDPAILKDFHGMAKAKCLTGRFVGIHSTALQRSEHDLWHSRTAEASLVWSPFSNLWLYGGTTDVLGARRAGVRICLGADWTPSGSRHLLGELKVADLYNRERLDGAFSAREIVRMATSNPADALGWDLRLGRLRRGLHADFVIVSDRPGDPYQALIDSTERDVQLVAINGYPMYGTEELMKDGAAVNPEPLTVGRWKRMVTLQDDRFEGADLGWDEIIESLEHIREDPPAAFRKAIERERKKNNEKVLQLKADKHFDDPEVHDDLLDLERVRDQGLIPDLDPLAHDGDYFDAVDVAGFHGGLLSGLRDYYPHVRKRRFKRPAEPARPIPA